MMVPVDIPIHQFYGGPEGSKYPCTKDMLLKNPFPPKKKKGKKKKK